MARSFDDMVEAAITRDYSAQHIQQMSMPLLKFASFKSIDDVVTSNSRLLSFQCVSEL
jgi:hypothetical protein